MSEIEVAAEAEDALHHPPKEVPGEKPYPNPVYAWYVVAVLVVAYTFSFIDRQILSLLVEPMRRDLQISDFQISLLHGIAFAIFYTFMGLPIGRMVDRRRRVTIISVGILVWSLMTAACGVARNYWQLFTFRMGVGAGEAALSPAAYSMISDYFPPKRMGFALGVYGMGVYIGAGLALVIGAEVIALVSQMESFSLPVFGEIYPWQAVFLAVGLPGILVALWMATIREPERRGHMRKEIQADGTEKVADVPLSEVLGYIRANFTTILCQNVAYAFAAMMAYGVAAWVPTFFIRTHGWTAVEAGRVYGWIIVIFGTAGVVCGGYLADRLSERYRSGRMMVMVMTAAFTMPFAFAYPLLDDMTLVLICLSLSTFFATFSTGAGPSALQELMPNQMRGFASALMIFVVTLIGLGLGPSTIAFVTDYVYGDVNDLRYSLAYVPLGILVLAMLFALAGIRPYAKSRDYLERWVEENEKPG